MIEGKKKIAKLIPLFIVAVVAFLYWQVLWFEFVHLDEDILVFGNAQFYQQPMNIFELFRHDVFYPAGVTTYYRPIYTISFMVNALIGGTSPMIYYGTNILLHAAVSVLLFFLMMKLGVSRTISAFAAILFAVHPTVVQTVAWIPSRCDSLVSIFIMTSIIAFLVYLDRREARWFIIHLFIFALAVLTKEIALMVPVVVSVYLIIFRSSISSREKMQFCLGWGIIILTWFLARHAIFQQNQVATPSITDLFSMVIFRAKAILVYLGKTVIPLRLSVFPILQDSTVIFGSIVLMLIVLVGCLMRKQVNGYFFWGFFWFLAFLLPGLINVDNPEQMAFFEHRNYVPTIGIIILFFSGLDTPRIDVFRHPATRFLFACVILSFLVVSIRYLPSFKNASVFWQSALETSPHSARVHRELGNVLVSQKEFSRAESEYRIALELNPNEKLVHNNLALLYRKIGDMKKYELELKEELRVDSFSVVAHFNLGNWYAKNGKFEQAIECWMAVLRVQPSHILTHQSLAVYYFQQRDFARALSHTSEFVKYGGILNDSLRRIAELQNVEQ